MNKYALTTIIFGILLGSGCSSTSVGYNSHCKDNSDCSAGQVCSNNQCIDYYADASDLDDEPLAEQEEYAAEDAEKTDETLVEFDAETEKDEQSELPEISDETADEEAETSEPESEADETEEEEQCDCSPYAGRYCVDKRNGDCFGRSPEIIVSLTEGALCSLDVAITDGTSSQSFTTGYCGFPTDFNDCSISASEGAPFLITLSCGAAEKTCVMRLTVSACGADGDEDEYEQEAEEICETVNQCGACGPDLPDFGKDCAVSEECAGTYVCAVDGMSLECKPKNANACGLCNGPEILGLGENCGDCGKNVCNEAGDGVVCLDGGLNECGACGPSLPDKGNACVGANSCEGTLACSDNGLKLICQYPQRNNCGLCGGLPVEGIGGDCGECGKYSCNNVGDGAVCVDPGKNECGVCGEKLPGKGASCGDCGTYVCASDGLSLLCDDPGRNVCGACGPQLTGKGEICGECGVKICSQDGQSLVCGGSDAERCALPNVSTYSCIEGVCGIILCLPSYYDADKKPENGCECKPDGNKDLPGDLIDNDCDGFDGDIDDSIFVSLNGSDGNSGSMTAPVRSFKKAIELAKSNNSAPFKPVIAGLGVWNEKIETYAGVSMFGGYDDAKLPWTASDTNKTAVSTDGYALTAEGITVPTTIQGFEFRGKAAQNQNGKSAAVIYLKTNSDALVFKNCSIIASDGNAGADGQKGSDGAAGGAGTTPPKGMNQIGIGGTSTCGAAGANGGLSGCGWNDGKPGAGVCGGEGGNIRHVQGYAPNCAAKAGQPGNSGAGGKANVAVNLAGEISSTGGQNGSPGSAGEGGSGGGGGRGANEWFDDKCGGGGGGGGAGGCGGGGASGGGAGGSSFGVVVSGGYAKFVNCSITAGSGGKGGDGKQGGRGGDGGAGGGGGDHEGNIAGDGGPGSAGGKGGDGGASGGGAGGSSAAFLLFDAAADKVILQNCQIKRGNPGAGGKGGADSNAGAQGLSQDYITATP